MPHPSQSAPGFGFQDTNAFLQSVTQGAPAGLPKKVINVDTDKQPGVSEQTSGQLYGDYALSDAVNMQPALCCPNCGEPACGMQGAVQPYTRDVQETGGKTHKGDIPPCPVGGVARPKLLYSVDPCGCAVPQEWASAFSKELHSRLRGNPPRELAWLSEKERQAKLEKLENDLTRLYHYQSLAGDAETKKDADYWIVVVVDQIRRLCPGAHNKKLPAKPLHPEVASWAAKNGLDLPKPHAAEGGMAYPEPAKVFGYGPGFKAPPGFKKTKFDPAAVAKLANPSPYKDGLADVFKHATDKLFGKLFDSLGVPPDTLKVTYTSGASSTGAGVPVPPVQPPTVPQPTPAPVPQKKPALQTLPEGWDEQVKFHGATADEKEIYLKGLQKILAAKGPELAKVQWPDPLLRAVLDAFAHGKGTMLSIIHQEVFGYPVDTVTLMNVANKIRHEVEDLAKGKAADVSGTTGRFLQAFLNLVDFSDQPKKKLPKVDTKALLGPPPAITEPLPGRHVKKKRTIRYVDEDEK